MAFNAFLSPDQNPIVMRILFRYSALALFLSLSLLTAVAQQNPGADSAARLIDTALSFAQKNSLYRASVNWKAVDDSVRKTAAGATSIRTAMPAMKLLYTMLKDHHGFVLHQNKYYKWSVPQPKLDTAVYRGLLKQIRQKNNAFAVMLEDGYGYLSIPDNNPTQWGDNDRIAAGIQDALNTLHPEKLKGLILDLRLNPGGSMFPMLGGIMNVFGQGELGVFVDPVTKTGEHWGVREHRIYDGADTAYTLKRKLPDLQKLKIVVLIGPNTASSGEATAISLKGRKNTWFVGEPSGGYTTSNQSIQFSPTTGIFMAVSVESDRNGTIYLDNVKPDQTVVGGDNFEQLNQDLKVAAGLRWLKKSDQSWLHKIRSVVGQLVFNTSDK